MGCRKYRNELSDAAAGTLAEERRRALDEHLAGCPGCRAQLERLERSLAAIDRALAESAAAEPSPSLLRGFYERLAPVGQRSPRAAGISRSVVIAAAATLALAVAAWMLHGRQPAPSSPAPVTAAAQPAAPAAHAAPVSGRPHHAATTASRVAVVAARHHTPPARRRRPNRDRSIFAEAKIPPEGPAIARLVELIQSGKIDPQSLFAPMQTKIEPIAINPIEIKPIAIPPIDIGGDTGKPNGQPSGPASSGASEAGANKERKP